MMPIEAILIEELNKGSIEAFDELFRRYAPRLHAFGLKYLKSNTDAEELVQDVFLKIWKNKNKLDKTQNFKSYLFTIAFNQIKDYFTHKLLYLETINDTLLPPDLSPLESISYQSILDNISVLIERLPSRKKQIFKLSRFEGKSSAEIAALLKITPKTVDNQISEVIHLLKSKINPSDLLTILFFYLFVN
ncbi:RNA polymerase sigma factor [Geofilum sp. OHC36d9]|uniref:RNA polymerase sigma factor n=1 Tax=Geofilum sp. OHC36d9 TaxID=3458413 RepID=UPI004034370C